MISAWKKMLSEAIYVWHSLVRQVLCIESHLAYSCRMQICNDWLTDDWLTTLLTYKSPCCLSVKLIYSILSKFKTRNFLQPMLSTSIIKSIFRTISNFRKIAILILSRSGKKAKVWKNCPKSDDHWPWACIFGVTSLIVTSLRVTSY